MFLQFDRFLMNRLIAAYRQMDRPRYLLGIAVLEHNELSASVTSF